MKTQLNSLISLLLFATSLVVPAGAYSRGMADLVIRPEVSSVHWADFADYERCIAAGVAAAEEAVPRIREMLRHERVFSLVRPGAGKRLAELTLDATGLKLVVV